MLLKFNFQTRSSERRTTDFRLRERRSVVVRFV